MAPRRHKVPAATPLPCLLVAGSENHLSKSASNGKIARRLRDAELRVIDDAGHLLPFERPEELTTTILDWFAQKDITLS